MQEMGYFGLTFSWSHTCTLLNPRRDGNGGDPHSQSIKGEVKRFGAHNPIGTGHPTRGGRHVVVKPSMLIVRDEKEGLVPLRAGPQHLVHLLHEHLPLIHIVRWVIVIGGEHLNVHVPLLHHSVARQLPLFRVLLERQVVWMELQQVLQLPKVPVEERGRNVLEVYAEV